MTSNRGFGFLWLLALSAFFTGASTASAGALGDFEFELSPYVEYSAGLSIVRNQNLSGGDAPNPDFWGSVRTDPGFNVGAALGTGFVQSSLGRLRGEIAVGYRQNDVGNQSVRRGESDAKGDLSLFTAMVNGYFDYDLSKHGIVVTPWVGVGVGFGRARLDAETKGEILQIDDDDAGFAWNVMVGGTYPLNETTHFSLGYRYLATEDIKFKGRVEDSGIKWIDSEYDAHEVTLGMRFNF